MLDADTIAQIAAELAEAISDLVETTLPDDPASSVEPEESAR